MQQVLCCKENTVRREVNLLNVFSFFLIQYYIIAANPCFRCLSLSRRTLIPCNQRVGGKHGSAGQQYLKSQDSFKYINVKPRYAERASIVYLLHKWLECLARILNQRHLNAHSCLGGGAGGGACYSSVDNRGQYCVKKMKIKRKNINRQ